MKEFLPLLLLLIMCVSIMGFSLQQMVAIYNMERQKQFIANCEYTHGKIEKDSYGTLYCVRDVV